MPNTPFKLFTWSFSKVKPAVKMGRGTARSRRSVATDSPRDIAIRRVVLFATVPVTALRGYARLVALSAQSVILMRMDGAASQLVDCSVKVAITATLQSLVEEVCYEHPYVFFRQSCSLRKLEPERVCCLT